MLNTFAKLVRLRNNKFEYSIMKTRDDMKSPDMSKAKLILKSPSFTRKLSWSFLLRKCCFISSSESSPLHNPLPKDSRNR